MSFQYTASGGVLVTVAAGSTVLTAAGGELNVNSDGSWSYTPPVSADHSLSDSLDESFTYTATDNSGLSSSALQAIALTDTEPTAADDLDTLQGRSGSSTSGNVITGVDTDSSPDALLAADVLGSDEPVSILSVRSGANSVSFDNPADVQVDGDGRYIELTGAHGTLQIREDGSYVYTVTDAYDPAQSLSTQSVGGVAGAGAWSGVSLLAYDFGTSFVDPAGHFAAGTADGVVTFTARGIGVKGTQNNMPAPDQINRDAVTGESQALAVDFRGQVVAARVTVSNLFRDEEDGEVGRWQAFDGNGVKVGEGVLDVSTITYVDNNVGTATVQVLDADGNAVAFRYLVFDSLPYADESDNPLTDSSDYFIRAISYDALTAQSYSEQFEYTIRDTDGDTSSAKLTIAGEIPVPPPVSVVLDGAGDSQLWGSEGTDVFRWTLAEPGAQDTIGNFDMQPPADQGDVLDLADLLPPESAGNLTSYLQFEDSGNGGTLIKISTLGEFTGDPDHDSGVDYQSIELSNVDLLSLGTDQQIIDSLINSGKLITD